MVKVSRFLCGFVYTLNSSYKKGMHMSTCEIGLFIEDQHLGFEVEFNYTEHDDRIEVLSVEAHTEQGNKNADFLRFTNAASIEEAIRAEQYEGC